MSSDKGKWDNAFDSFEEQVFFDKLNDKVKDKSYRQKNKSWVQFIKFCSYVFNIASALAAVYACFWLGEKLTGNTYVAVGMSVIFLALFEIAKRKTSGEFWQVYWFKRKIATGWLTASLVILFFSILSSSFGTKKGTNNLSPEADIVEADATATDYRDRIAKLETSNTKLEKQTDHKGKILYRVLPSIKANNKQIEQLNSKIIELDTKLNGKRESLTRAYADEVDVAGWILVVFTLLMELLFECCICYVWFYYHRVHVEMVAMGLIHEEVVERQQVIVKEEVVKYVKPKAKKKKKKPKKKKSKQLAPVATETKTGFIDLTQPNSSATTFSDNQQTERVEVKGFRNQHQEQEEKEASATTLSVIEQLTQKKEKKPVMLVKQASQPENETAFANETETNVAPDKTEDIDIETIIDKRYLKQQCKQCYVRSHKQSSKEKTRTDNKNRYLAFRKRLLELGVKTKLVNSGKGGKNVVFEE